MATYLSQCTTCGRKLADVWWWMCDVHGVRECDGCSIPHDDAAGRRYEDSSHRFQCGFIEGPFPPATIHPRKRLRP